MNCNVNANFSIPNKPSLCTLLFLLFATWPLLTFVADKAEDKIWKWWKKVFKKHKATTSSSNLDKAQWAS